MGLDHPFQRSRNCNGRAASIADAKRTRRKRNVIGQAIAEGLELRTMLTAVTLTGDAGATAITINRIGDTVDFFQNTPTNGQPTQAVPFEDLSGVTINQGSGPVTLTLDYQGGDLLQFGSSLTLNPFTSSSTGPLLLPTNQLVVANLPGANYTLSSSGLSIIGGSFTDSVGFTGSPSLNLFGSGGTSNLEVASGTTTFNSDLGGSGASVNVTVDSGAELDLGATQHLNSLTIDAGAKVVQDINAGTPSGNQNKSYSPGGQVLVTNSLVVSGILDLNNNDLIVEAPSPAAMTTLQEQVADGLNGTDTAGGGTIKSSTAAQDQMTIGVTPATSLENVFEPLTSLDGQAINQGTTDQSGMLQGGALVARYVRPGDVNIDGVVNGLDLNLVASHFNKPVPTTPPVLTEGDVNYDGTVNGIDLNGVASYFNDGDGLSPVAVSVGTPYVVPFPPFRLVTASTDGTSTGETEALTASSPAATLPVPRTLMFQTETLATRRFP